jgi:hypothetical protein
LLAQMSAGIVACPTQLDQRQSPTPFGAAARAAGTWRSGGQTAMRRPRCISRSAAAKWQSSLGRALTGGLVHRWQAEEGILFHQRVDSYCTVPQDDPQDSAHCRSLPISWAIKMRSGGRAGRQAGRQVGRQASLWPSQALPLSTPPHACILQTTTLTTLPAVLGLRGGRQEKPWPPSPRQCFRSGAGPPSRSSCRPATQTSHR